MEATKIFAAAIYFVWDKRVTLAKALSVPFGIYVLLGMAFQEEAPASVIVLHGLLTLAIHTLFAITTHRIMLLGEDSVPAWGLRRWTMRESYFFCYSLVLGCLFLPVAVVFFIPYVGFFLGPATLLYLLFWVYPGLCLVFPGVAVDKTVSLRRAWELTRNYRVPMAWIIVLFPVLFGIPAIIVSVIPYTYLLVLVLETMANVYTIAALSIAYREICRLES